MPVADDRRGDVDAVADARLRGPAAAIDLRRDVGDVIRSAGTPRHGKQSAVLLERSLGVQLHPDVAPGRPAGAGGVRLRRLAGGGRGALVAGPARSTRRTSSARPYASASAFARWGGLLADPDARGGAERGPGLPGSGSDAWCDDWAAYRRRRRASRSRCGSSASGAPCARYAAERGVEIIGDVPIYVAVDGCDHRATPSSSSRSTRSSPGAPPDELNDLGQLWGNPLYDWQAMAARRLPLVDRPDAPRARPRRPLPDRPLPRVRRATGRFPQARRARGTAGGRRGRAGRSSVQPRRRSGRCR